MQPNTIVSTSAVVLSLVLGSACSSAPTLQPATAANEAKQDTGLTSSDGVVVTADPGWTGKVRLESALTPVRVTVENHSGDLLQIRYNDFQLRSADGTVYRALPLTEIEGVAMAWSGEEEDLQPRRSRNFTYSPYYANIEPGLNVFDEDYEHDGFATRGPAFYEVRLPTEAMFSAALPEGVLEDGGFVEGYLYFERVDEDAKQVTFLASFEPVPEQAKKPKVSIPFTVEDK